jgi:hypothetical protein
VREKVLQVMKERNQASASDAPEQTAKGD